VNAAKRAASWFETASNKSGASWTRELNYSNEIPLERTTDEPA